MAGSERRTGALAALLLAAGVLAALLGEHHSAARRGAGAPSGPRDAPPVAGAWRELPAVDLGTRDLRGITVAGDGAVAVIAGGALAWLGADLAVERRVPLPGAASCLAADGGRIFVGLRDRIAVLERRGAAVAEWQSLGERAWLTSIAARGEEVLVADAGNRLVWRFDAAGRLRGSFGRRDPAAGEEGFVVPSPFFDLALSPAGDLWVANPGEHRLERRSLEGRLLGAWGSASADPGGFSGCCNPSHFALLADGSFVTSEKGTPRVTLYDRDGRYRETVAGAASFAPRALGLDLAVDARGRVLVLDPPGGRLRVFARDAGASTAAGGGGRDGG